MNSQNKTGWNDILLKSFEKAAEKVNRISVAKWEFSLQACAKPENYDAVCCYFQVKDSSIPMIFAMLFRRSDAVTISKSLLGYGFFISQKMSKSEELLMEELSNIILTSLISEIANFLGVKIIPSGPKTAQAPRDTAVEIISSLSGQNNHMVCVASSAGFSCAGDKVSCEIYSFFDKKIAQRLLIE